MKRKTVTLRSVVLTFNTLAPFTQRLRSCTRNRKQNIYFDSSTRYRHLLFRSGNEPMRHWGFFDPD